MRSVWQKGSLQARAITCGALVRAERDHQLKREALFRDIDEGIEDIAAGRVYGGEEVFAKLLGEEESRPGAAHHHGACSDGFSGNPLPHRQRQP